MEINTNGQDPRDDSKKAKDAIKKFDIIRENYGERVVFISMDEDGKIQKHNGLLGSILDFTTIEANIFMNGSFHNSDYKLYENPSLMLLGVLSLEGKGSLFSLGRSPREISDQRKKELEDIENNIAKSFPQNENMQLLELNKIYTPSFIDLQRRLFIETYGTSVITTNDKTRLDTLNNAYLYFAYFYPELIRNNINPENIFESAEEQIDIVKAKTNNKPAINDALKELNSIRNKIKSGNLPLSFTLGIDPTTDISKLKDLAANARTAKVSFNIVAEYANRIRNEITKM